MELAWAAPWVIAERVSHSDGRERARMVTEKMAAGVESWNALASYAFAQQRSLMRGVGRHRTWGGLVAGAPVVAWMTFLRSSERGLADMVAPYRRRASANARRLKRRSRRQR